MKNKMKLVIVAAAICAFAISCGNSGKGGKVLFESDDKKIKGNENEVNLELEKSLFSSGVSQKDLTPDQITQMKKNIIQNIALNRALVLKAKEQKLDKDKKYTEQNFQDMVKFATEEYKKELEKVINLSQDDAFNIAALRKAYFLNGKDAKKLIEIVKKSKGI